MYHSNQVREYKITSEGIKLLNLYLGPARMLTGSARVSQIEKEKAEKLDRKQEIEINRENLNRNIK